MTCSPLYVRILDPFGNAMSERPRFFVVSHAKSPFPAPSMPDGAILSLASAARCCQQNSVPMHTVRVQGELSAFVPWHLKHTSLHENFTDPGGASNLYLGMFRYFLL